MRRTATDNQPDQLGSQGPYGGSYPGLQTAFNDGSTASTNTNADGTPIIGGEHGPNLPDTVVPLPGEGSEDPLPQPASSSPGHVNLSGAGGYAPVTLLDYLVGAQGTNLGRGGQHGETAPTQGGMVGSSRGNAEDGTPYSNLGATASTGGAGMGAYVGGGYTTGMSLVDNYVYGNRGALNQPQAPAAATPAAPTPATTAPVAPAPLPAPTGPMAPRPTPTGSIQDTSDTQEQRYKGLQGSFGGY